MTNIERLKMQLSNRQYLDDSQYSVLLLENGLNSDEQYFTSDQRALLCTVLDVLEILSNDIDNFRRIETEFATTTAAFEALSTRILEIKNKIAAIDADTGRENDSPFTFMYTG